METDAIMPTTLNPMPDAYSTINIGPYYKHVFQNEWMMGLNVQAGSSSDNPFEGFNEMTIGANATLRIPSGKKNAWIAFVNYSSNRDFLSHIPIPGFGYSFDANWGRGIAGIPAISLQLLHKKPVNFVLRYFPIITTYAEMGWDISRMFRLAANFSWHDDHFWRSARQEEKYQTFIVQKDIGGFFVIKVAKFLMFKFGGGVSFNRSIFEAKSVIKDSSYNRMNLDAAPYGSFSLTAVTGGS